MWRHETECKARFYNHSHSFKYQRKSDATELSKAFWLHKTNGKSPLITWEIVTQSTPHQPGARVYMLCLAEKCAILQACPTTSLNKRTELMGKCRPTNKFFVVPALFSIPSFSRASRLAINPRQKSYYPVPPAA